MAEARRRLCATVKFVFGVHFVVKNPRPVFVFFVNFAVQSVLIRGQNPAF